MKDSKPYKPDEVGDAHFTCRHNRDRLFATARAAAEADSLRARLEEEQKQHRATHDDRDQLWATSSDLRAEVERLRAQLEEARKATQEAIGRGNDRLEMNRVLSERAEAELRAQMEEARGFHTNEHKDRLAAEAALTTAQGEVAVLRSKLHEVVAGEKGTSRVWGDYKNTAWHCDLCDADERDDNGRHRPECILASTRATAAAHDERVRREALEEAEERLGQCTFSGALMARDVVRALAHPTKEPK